MKTNHLNYDIWRTVSLLSLAFGVDKLQMLNTKLFYAA